MNKATPLKSAIVNVDENTVQVADGIDSLFFNREKAL